MNILQDIIGLITKRKIKTPSDKDYIVSAAYTNTQEILKPQPKMEASLLNIGALKSYIVNSITANGLQEVTDIGATTTNTITVNGITSGNLYSDGYNFGISDNIDNNYNMLYQPYSGLQITDTINYVYLYQDASIGFQTAVGDGNLRSDLLTSTRTWQFPDASGTLALTSDIPLILPYKVYTALLTQIGTNNPTAIVLENTTGATVSFSRSVIGIYNVNFSSSVLTTNKTFILVNSFDNNDRTIFGQIGGPAFAIITTRNAGATIDGILDNTTLEIRIYN